MAENRPQKPLPPAARSTAGHPEQWVDEHGDALFRFALLRVRDRSIAEDLVQESFLAGLKSRPTFRGESDVRTWLIGILRHKILDHLRQSERNRATESSDEADALIDSWFTASGHWAKPPARWEIDPAQLMQKEEFWQVLRACLEGVPGRAGEAFALRMLSDIPATDVCKELNITSTNSLGAAPPRPRSTACLP